jgi:hypothetical protein
MYALTGALPVAAFKLPSISDRQTENGLASLFRPHVLAAPEQGDGGLGCKVDQMGIAAAIRAAETRRNNGGARHLLQSLCPYVFIEVPVMTVPDFRYSSLGSEKIHMPVGISGETEMMPKPGSQSARTAGAADIGIPPGGKIESTQLPDR